MADDPAALAATADALEADLANSEKSVRFADGRQVDSATLDERVRAARYLRGRALVAGGMVRSTLASFSRD